MRAPCTCRIGSGVSGYAVENKVHTNDLHVTLLRRLGGIDFKQL